MRLEDAKQALRPFIGVRFGTILPQHDLADLKTDKGLVGKILERAIGLRNSSATLDFEDGELKTNKCSPNGAPRETMFITQISSIIDDLLEPVPFARTCLHTKIQNILYVPVCKDGPNPRWMFLPPIHVNLRLPHYAQIARQLEADYDSITRQLKDHVRSSSDGFIHTSSGEFIQVRSKDCKPYHPIYSRRIGRNVSNKNHAFYFMKEFMIHLQANSPDYPYIAGQ